MSISQAARKYNKCASYNSDFKKAKSGGISLPALRKMCLINSLKTLKHHKGDILKVGNVVEPKIGVS